MRFMQRNTKMVVRAAGAALVAMAALATGAARAEGLGLSYAAYHMGQPTAAPVQQGEFIRSGEKLLIKIRYMNQAATSTAAGAVVFTLPEGCAFVNSDHASNLTVSVDGGYRFGLLASLRVWENGRWRIAVGSDVTHVRLTLDHAVAPGETGEVSIVAAHS